MFLVTIWLWCQERWETGIPRWHMAPGLSHGCRMCNNALFRWSWAAPALFCCSHLCLAPWSQTQLCNRWLHKSGVLMVIVYVGVVQNLWEMVEKNGVGIPGLSNVSFRFVKGFLHPWPKQCLEAFTIRATRALLIMQRGLGGAESQGKPRTALEGLLTISWNCSVPLGKSAFVSKCLGTRAAVGNELLQWILMCAMAGKEM